MTESRLKSFAIGLVLVTSMIPFGLIQTAPEAEAALVDPIDYNNDGFGDLCIGIPYEDVVVMGVNRGDAGAVSCIYGSAVGLTSAGDLFLTQPAGAIPGGPEDGDNFGYALASGNFNGDAFDDLCVGVPGEDIGAGPVVNAGLVHCFFGSATGIVASPGQVLTQNVGAIADTGEASDAFGWSLASGNLNLDAYDDLCIGVPFEDLPGPLVDAGAVHCLRGSATGLDTTAAGGVFIYQGATVAGDVVAETAEAGDAFGWSLGTGDWNNGGAIDLCIGVPFEDIPGEGNVGLVNCVSGVSPGIIDPGLYNVAITQDSVLGGVAIADLTEPGDEFGWSLVGGDYDGDDNADLCVGVPFEDIGSPVVPDAGAVNCIYGSSSGLTGTGNQFINQNSVIDGVAILDVGEAADNFGYSLASADYNNGGNDDLCVGVPFENLVVGGITQGDAGAVNCLYGVGSHLTGSGNEFWHQDVPGIEGGVEAGDFFGQSLTTGDFQADGPHDLCIGVPSEDIGSVMDAGAVNCIYGIAAGGLDAAGDVIWYQDVAGIDDVSESFDHYGWSLEGDIVVTASPAPEEELGGEYGDPTDTNGEG